MNPSLFLHGLGHAGDDIFVTGRLAHTFHIHEVEGAVGMGPTLNRPKVGDCVQSTRNIDQFTIYALGGIESEGERELLGYSALSVGGGGAACVCFASSPSVNSPPASASAEITATTLPRFGMTIMPLSFP
jgi:hypothetical protein